MALSAKLELRQSQSLVMTPQLMQAIKLLQLSNLDLAAYVENELERNPLLEREDPDISGAEAVVDSEKGHTEDSEDSDSWMKTELDADGDKILANVDMDTESIFSESEPSIHAGHSHGSSISGYSAASRGENYNLEAVVASERSLADHLVDQLSLATTDPVQRLIGRYLIDCIDESGYLRTDIESAAKRLGTTPKMVEDALATVQGLDPAGIGARDLSECLSLQLSEKNRLDPAMSVLLDNLDLVARGEMARLKNLCGVGDEDLAEMLAEIRALNPRPGNLFGSTPVQPVIPDVFVRARPDGGWMIELNTDTLPRLLVNQRYYAEIVSAVSRESDKTYLNDCLQTANWLVKSLDQRARTILKVSSEIVRQQDAFFAQGVEHLRPLNLRMIADAIGMHESTVSRVTANKYMATNRGIFELKFFFTAAIASSSGGDAHSAEAVRYRIKALIEEESAENVLSDDAIVAILRSAGIDIARRTVAKYREAMRIPSSVQRRRLKRLEK